MPVTGTVTFTDPDDYRASFWGMKIDLCLTGPGQFHARLTRADLPHIYLLRAEEKLSRIARLSFSSKRIFVAFAIGRNPAQFWDGLKLGRWDIMLLHGRSGRVHHRTNRGTSWGLICVEPECFRFHCKVFSGSDIPLPPGQSILRPSRAAALHLRDLYRKICNLAARQNIIAHSEVARALEHDLLHALVNCLTADRLDVHAYTRWRHADIVDQFQDDLTASPEQPVSMAELSARVGVPERTLRACCVEILGVSPTRYLRLRRLNMVRAALQRALPAQAGVGEVAKQYGFSELGRFAVLYRQFFGETPSTTFRRRVDQHAM